MTKVKFMLAGALATTLATTAMANECSHSGFYAGGQVGLGMMKSQEKGSAENNLSANGITGGVHVGFGKQTNRFYMGIETFGNFSNIKSNNGDEDDNTKIKRQYNFGAALRPGIVFGNALFYVKLGLDSSKFKIVTTETDSSPERVSKHRLGFVPGLGASFLVTKNIVLGLESTYSMYRKIRDREEESTHKNHVLDTVVRASYKW